MPFATQNEIEYLGSIAGRGVENPRLVDEMWQRLEALRRYDQNFSDSDWRPPANTKWHPAARS